ncbi:MAG TPA: TetR/AcrR family transcriptional regulator [Clostridia bacterium]|nr:TetR/AcrR family transcriptional regulator [Clostridia bacterium]
MTSLSRRDQQRSQLRREILDAASAAFANKGYEQLSMRKLAAQLACSPGTLYLYFRDKDELLHAVVEGSFAELLKGLRAIPDDGDPVGLLKTKLRAYIEFGLRNPNHYKCAFVLPPGQDRKRPYKPHPAFDELVQALRRCVESGLLPEADLATTSQVVWSCIHGLTSLLIARPAFPWVDREKLIDELIETATAGIAFRAVTASKREGGRNGSSRSRSRK